MGALKGPPSLLVLHASHRAEMARHVAAELPLEACGILAGEAGRSRAVFPAENVLKSSFRFRMDPQQQLNIFLELETRGWDLLAVFHSHPSGPPGPSATDLAEAFYPEALQIIWSPGPDAWRCRAYQIDSAGVRDVPIELVP